VVVYIQTIDNAIEKGQWTLTHDLKDLTGMTVVYINARGGIGCIIVAAQSIDPGSPGMRAVQIPLIPRIVKPFISFYGFRILGI
jgi:hypothetical protein